MARNKIKLSAEEQVILMGNLGLFHGDWDLHTRWLRGFPKDSDRYKDIKSVETFIERDKKERIRENYLINNIHSYLLDFKVRELVAVWEHCRLLSSEMELEQLKKNASAK